MANLSDLTPSQAFNQITITDVQASSAATSTNTGTSDNLPSGSTENVTAAPRVIQTDQGLIAPSSSQFITDTQAGTLDRNWVQEAFMMPDTGFSDPADVQNRYYSTANMKYTDTRLGYSIGINPRPQFCHYSDVPVPGRIQRNVPMVTDFSGNYGLGRQYSEFVDDPAQRIYMTFGVPQFNSLTQFLSAAYEANQTTLARTGRASSLLYNAGLFVGRAALLYAFPLLAIPFFVSNIQSYFTTKPKSKFYTMKPTMPLYWNAVGQVVNALMINRGLMPKVFATVNDQINNQQRIGTAYKLDTDYLQLLSTFSPQIFNRGGLIPGHFDNIAIPMFDIAAIACRAQLIANKVLQQDYENLNAGTGTNYVGYVQQQMFGNNGHATPISEADGTPTLSATLDYYTDTTTYLNKFFESNSTTDGMGTTPDTTNVTMEVDPNSMTQNGVVTDDGKTKSQNFWLALDAFNKEGGQYAIFIVDHTGPQSETWSNSVGESELAQTLNQKANDFAEARFTFADGNIVSGAIGDVVGMAASAVSSAAQGLLSGVTMGLSNIAFGIASGGYVDIPKHWRDSSFSATRASYTMQLISPYGNPMSQMMAIDIPIAMLMTGALPRSTGHSSYTSPFLCQVFDRGRCQIRLGMIESLSFSRGTSHLSFSDTGKPMAIDVSFSIVDLSSIMHMPMANGSWLGGPDITSDPDSILHDYLAVLVGASIESQIYGIAQAKINLAKQLMNAQQALSSFQWAMVASDTIAGDVMRLFSRQASVFDISGANT